jgi:Domain of unknown function (DUF4760)
VTKYEVLALIVWSISVVVLIIQVQVGINAVAADHERRRKQSTIEYIGGVWRDARHELERDYGPSGLSTETLKKILEDYKLEADIRNLLGVLEHMSVGLHAGIYDKDLLYRMTATFIIQTYHRFEPYMMHKRNENPTMYIEFQRLAIEFRRRKESEIGDSGKIKRS